jgi:hypothetical protein
MVNIVKKSEIIFHFNKMSLQDPNIPMWVIKTRGQSYYVDHLDVDAGIGFSSKETPDNPSTKGSMKFKGKLEIKKINEEIIARIYP